MGIKADESDPDPLPSKREQRRVSEPPEFLSKFKEMGIKADENDPDPVPEIAEKKCFQDCVCCYFRFRFLSLRDPAVWFLFC